jgi:hypothetical protein
MTEYYYLRTGRQKITREGTLVLIGSRLKDVIAPSQNCSRSPVLIPQTNRIPPLRSCQPWIKRFVSTISDLRHDGFMDSPATNEDLGQTFCDFC